MRSSLVVRASSGGRTHFDRCKTSGLSRNGSCLAALHPMDNARDAQGVLAVRLTRVADRDAATRIMKQR
jgi:hypothetical protein